ncbi:MAG: winged helix DNA-binding protein [Candidatus Caldarchaeum sp.]
MEALVLVFVCLFFTQTVVFVYLYRRAVMQRDVMVGSDIQPRSVRGSEKPVDAEEAGLTGSALAALRLIRDRGSVMSSDVSRSLSLSREHTARLLKSLYEKGLVNRSGKPFRYSLTEKGLEFVSSETMDVDRSSQ